MRKLFAIRRSMGRDDVLDPADVFRTKAALAALGHYTAPDAGMTPWPEDAIFDGLRAFQKERGLVVDGWMRPGGPTESALADALRAQAIEPEEWDAKNDRPARAPRSILGDDAGDDLNALPAPDSAASVVPAELYRKLDFDSNPKADGQYQVSAKRPIAAARAAWQAWQATEMMMREYGRFSVGGVHLPSEHRAEADAFRHLYWSFEMARTVGPEAAKAFADGHERTTVEETPERLKDLYNNRLGRELARDPGNARRNAREVVLEAIRSGRARIAPFHVAPSRERDSR